MRFFVALAACIAAADAASPAFCDVSNDICDYQNPTLIDEGFNLVIDATMGGLGNIESGRLIFSSYSEGFIDDVCINNGNEEPPGQNKDTGASGDLLVVLDQADASNGNYDFSITNEDACDCGVETGSFEKKVQGQWITKTCSGFGLWDDSALTGGCCLANAGECSGETHI